MAVHFVKGDVTLTRAQSILLALNSHGQVEVSPLETQLRDLYPVFFSEYRRMGRNEHLTPGQVWIFRESIPWFVGAVVRDSAQGIIKLRYLEQVLTQLRLEWRRENLESLAIAPMGDDLAWPALRALLEELLVYIPIPIFVYETYIPQQKVDEPE